MLGNLIGANALIEIEDRLAIERAERPRPDYSYNRSNAPRNKNKAITQKRKIIKETKKKNRKKG
jgi:hypothetical protein